MNSLYTIIILSLYFFTFQDKILYTPGPLMTTKSVKHSMVRDIGVGDPEFKEIVGFIQRKILKIAGNFIYNIKIPYFIYNHERR